MRNCLIFRLAFLQQILWLVSSWLKQEFLRRIWLSLLFPWSPYRFCCLFISADILQVGIYACDSSKTMFRWHDKYVTTRYLTAYMSINVLAVCLCTVFISSRCFFHYHLLVVFITVKIALIFMYSPSVFIVLRKISKLVKNSYKKLKENMPSKKNYHQISSYNITCESHIKIREKNMITN